MSKLDLELLRSDKQKELSQEISQGIGRCGALNSIGNALKQSPAIGTLTKQLSKNSIANRFKPSIFPIWRPLKTTHPEELRACQRYIDTLRDLLDDDEFKKPDVWVEFIKKQIDEFLELDVRAYHLPDMLDQEKKDIAYKEGKQQVPSSGGKCTAAPFRILESQVVAMAGEILKKACNHRDRPADMYRISTLAKKVFEWNKKLPALQKLSLPKESTIKTYIRKAVERGELPVYLKGNKPKKH